MPFLCRIAVVRFENRMQRTVETPQVDMHNTAERSTEMLHRVSILSRLLFNVLIWKSCTDFWHFMQEIGPHHILIYLLIQLSQCLLSCFRLVWYANTIQHQETAKLMLFKWTLYGESSRKLSRFLLEFTQMIDLSIACRLMRIVWLYEEVAPNNYHRSNNRYFYHSKISNAYCCYRILINVAKL